MLRSVFSTSAIVRLALGWLGVVGLALAHPLLAPPVAGPVLVITLALVIAVIVIAALGVVQQAEALAHRLGDPYGSLVLTLSIVAIEVILISAVMLGPGDHATIARDSVTAVMMIIMNLVIGVCLVVGGLRRGALEHNRTGTSQYLGMIAVLVVLAFVLPTALDNDGSYPANLALPIAIVTIAVYAFFLWRQMGAQAADFQVIDDEDDSVTSRSARVGEVVREHAKEITLRIVLLVATMLPIVLLSHDLASLLDEGLGRIGAPIALGGMLIALIVFTPESITAVRAAAGGEMQRVVNLCLGAFVSTVGLTIPAVLIIGLLTGQNVVLAESPVMLSLVLASVALSALTFSSKRVTAAHGGLHIVLFLVYLVVLFGVPVE